MTSIFKPANKEEIKQRQEKYVEILITEWIAEFVKRPDVTKNSDGSYDVAGNVALSKMNLTKIPIKFRKVNGYFWCEYNKLATLENSPKHVGRIFNCSNNELITLNGGPEYVGGSFYCEHNKLITLEGSPKHIGKNFECSCNKLTTLKDGPEYVGGLFWHNHNKLPMSERINKLKMEN